MAFSIFNRIAQGFGTIADFTQAKITDLETQNLQDELDSRGVSQATITQPIPSPTGDLFKDIARQFEITRDQIKEGIPETPTVQPEPKPEPEQKEPGFVQDIFQSINRNIASVGISIAKQIGKPLGINVADELSLINFPVLFGEDETVKSVETRVAETELAIKDEAKKVKKGEGSILLGRQIKPELADILEKNAVLFAFAGVVGSVGLDLLPVGGTAKGFAKAIINVKNIDEAAILLKKIGVTDDVAKKFSKAVVQTTKEADATKLVKQITELQKTTKFAPQVAKAQQAPPIDTVTARVIPRTRERGFITSVKELQPKIKISGEYIPRGTDALAIKAKNLIKTDIAAAERLAFEGVDDSAVATSSELIKHYNDLAQKATGTGDVIFYEKAAEVANVTARNLTEQGRAIQAASILGRLTPEGQLRFAAKEIQRFNTSVETVRGGLLGLRKKIPELTGEQSKALLQKSKKIQDMPDGVDKAIAFKKLQDEIADLVPSSLYKKLINLWKAGLLTGLKTSGLNIFSNLFHGISETAKDIPAVAVDTVASLFTGKRTIGFTAKGAEVAVSEGFTKGLRYMKTGFDERNVAAKLDWRRVNFGKSKFAKSLQAYESTVFRLMGAEDQPFYYGAKARSIGSQAIANGKNSGLKGEELGKFVNNLMQNPTDDMLRYATNDAEVAVFHNRTALGDLARSIQKIPGGEIVVPFGRTPSAVIMQTFNYSPFGIVKTIVDNIGKGRFDQRLFSQGLGRGMTGTAVLFIGIELFKNDLVALDRPTTEKERRQWELEGKKPNSVKIGDKWRNVNVLGPVGMLIVFGGQYQKFVEETGSFTKAIAPATAATAKSFTEQTFLTGVNQFASALNDPGRYSESVTSRLVGSVVPTLVSDIAKAADPLERRTGSRTEGFLAPLESRIPIIREDLQPRIDALGHPILRTGNAVETIIDPSRPSRIKSSEVIAELKRLMDVGSPATPSVFADEKKFIDILTPVQITYLQEKAGQILEEKLTNLIASSQYEELTDEEKASKISTFTTKSRTIARAEMVDELTKDLFGRALKSRLSELKENGFMTRSVFTKWKELFRR